MHINSDLFLTMSTSSLIIFDITSMEVVPVSEEYLGKTQDGGQRQI
jgi:hypothetical protein